MFFPHRHVRRSLRLGLLAPLLALAVALPVTLASAVPASAAERDRRIVTHVVRPGETATGLAVRYHAWTDELVALNRLRGGRLHVGQRIRIPVVVSAARRAGTAERDRTPRRTHRVRGWRNADLTRPQVRRLVARTARRHDVPVDLALAIAWQESGWQQRQVSSVGALGVMQVMPSTGRWMRLYAGRRLHLRESRDNVLAGVLTLKVLREHTVRDRRAIAAYYQGLGAVREHGLYDDTKEYVASVRAHRGRLAQLPR